MHKGTIEGRNLRVFQAKESLANFRSSKPLFRYPTHRRIKVNKTKKARLNPKLTRKSTQFFFLS